MSDYKIITVTSKDPEVAASEMEFKVDCWEQDGYSTSGGVSATTTNDDGETKIVLTQAMVKDD